MFVLDMQENHTGGPNQTSWSENSSENEIGIPIANCNINDGQRTPNTYNWDVGSGGSAHDFNTTWQLLSNNPRTLAEEPSRR